MFGRLKIRAPGGSGKMASGQVTLFREKTDDVRVILSTLTTSESQAFVASARASSKTGFSVDVVRANGNLPWDGEFITVNWFSWGAEIEKGGHAIRELRGSTALSNTTRIGDEEYLVRFERPLMLMNTDRRSSKSQAMVVVSARNENRAQVVAVNVVGQPTEYSFVVRVKRLDDSKAILEEEGTFIDWIAAVSDSNKDEDPDSTYNRTGSSSLRFDPPFASFAPTSSNRVFVIHTTLLTNPLPPQRLLVSSVQLQTLRGFTTSRMISIKDQRRSNGIDSDSSLEMKSEDDDDELFPRAKSNVMFIAWEGVVDECDSEASCSHRGSCVWTIEEQAIASSTSNPALPLVSRCACRSPFSGYDCDDTCPMDLEGLVCSGNGICSQLVPECECFSGWTGDLCNAKAYSADSRLVVVVVISVALFVCTCFGTWFTRKCRRRLSRERRLSNLRRALLGDDDDLEDVMVESSSRDHSMTRQRVLRNHNTDDQFEQINDALHGDAASWAISFEKLSFGSQIGQGSSSQVFIGLWAGQTVAIKKIAVPRTTKRRSAAVAESMDTHMDFWLYFKREAGFLATLHHPNIVRFFGVASQQDLRGFSDYFYLVTELCVASLSDFIRGPVMKRPPSIKLEAFNVSGVSQNSQYTSPSPSTGNYGNSMNLSTMMSTGSFQGGVDEDIHAMQAFVFDVFIQIARGMDFLHCKDVVHRDLKCDNVLLDPQNRVKLCDFGISRVVDRSKGYLKGTTTAMIATPAFMAPELISTGTYPCGTKVDVYSFGIVLWSFIQWKEPYLELQGTHSVYDLMSKITLQELRPSVKGSDWPDVLEQFYFRCVDADPFKRPSFDEILKLFGQKKHALAGLEPETRCELAEAIKQGWLKTYQRAYPTSSGTSNGPLG